MNAVQMLTGRGGWPMTVFLTPDQRPFYAGTYFPPTDRNSVLWVERTPTRFVFNVAVPGDSDQRIVAESVTVAPSVPFDEFRDPAGENRFVRFDAAPGAVSIRYRAATTDEAGGFFGQAQFFGRAHHAMRFDTANLADFDRKRLLAGFCGQGGAGQDQWNFVPGLEVVSAADNLPFAFAVVDAVEGKFVRVRVFVAGDDLRDDHAFEGAGDFLNAFDLDPEHGQPLGEFFGRPVEIHVLFQPVQCDFHFLSESNSSER